jgi:hypothetical protein
MKFLLSCALILSFTASNAQPPLTDSSMKEFTRLTCECITLMNVDKLSSDDAIDRVRTCIQSTVGVYVQNGWIKKEWLQDSIWATHFDEQFDKLATQICPAYKAFAERMDRDEPEPLPTVKFEYFLPASYMNKKGLVINTAAANANMERWSAKDMNTNIIQMVFDIRYVFNSEKEASDYLDMKLGELSEGGGKTANNLKKEGADESFVFGANPNLNSLFGDMDMVQYNFVFRVKNVVAKVFVSTSKKATYEQAADFAKTAIATIKNGL